MRKVTLVRDKPSPQGTAGIVTAGTHSCYSLELNDHGNAVGLSRIPAGDYLCEIAQSPKFGRVYEVKGVPGRTNILIHPGNFAADEGFGKSDVEGCILLGNAIGEIGGQLAMLSSRDAVMRFMNEMAGESFTLSINDHEAL